jgi:hypothetical protein
VTSPSPPAYSQGDAGVFAQIAALGRRILARTIVVSQTGVQQMDSTSQKESHDMKRMMVQYKVKPEKAAENQRFIERVFEELRANAPKGIRYITFKSDDGVSFTHLVSLETETGENPLDTSAAFQAFQAGLSERFAVQPTFTTLEEVGSYRVFDS